jgi:hypothetical protein
MNFTAPLEFYHTAPKTNASIFVTWHLQKKKHLKEDMIM